MRPDPPIVVIGAGLAGSLLSLELAERGLGVVVVGPSGAGATSLSYGGLPSPRACRRWRDLERRHGPLGFSRSRLALHGWPPPLAALPPRLQAWLSLPLPFGRVDTPRLQASLPEVLARAGVRRLEAEVKRLQPLAAGGWRLELAGADAGRSPNAELLATQVVLAAGAGSRSLWPGLPKRLRFSWAGVLVLDAADLEGSAASGWLAVGRGGALVQPLQLRRHGLEQGTAPGERWIVDAGLVPWGERLLLGQISLVGPGDDPQAPPDPQWMEARLREGLEELDPSLALLPGRYRQVPVAFCLDGDPLVGAVADAPAGLWGFCGFSGAFSTVPVLAGRLAERIAAAGGGAA